MEVDCSKFVCAHLVKGECEQGGGECLKDDCPEWGNCESCQKYEECEG